MMKKILIFLTHIVYTTWNNTKPLKEFASTIHNKTILEIGSGPFPSEKFFDKSNTFIKSDLNKKYGYRVIDVGKMTFKNKYDIIVSCNVLDDVYDFNKAITNIHNALKDKGTAFIMVNGLYPLHDLPHDYWRFTEYGLPNMFSKFRRVSIKRRGLKLFPISYSVIAIK